MSNRLFQGVIHQMKDAIDRTVGVVDETGTIISCSELGRIGEVQESSLSDVFTGGEVPRSIPLPIAHLAPICIRNTPCLSKARMTLPAVMWI